MAAVSGDYNCWASGVTSHFQRLGREEKLELLTRLYKACGADERSCLTSHLANSLLKDFMSDLPAPAATIILQNLAKGPIWKQALDRMAGIVADELVDNLTDDYYSCADTGRERRNGMMSVLWQRFTSLRKGSPFEIAKEFANSSDATAIFIAPFTFGFTRPFNTGTAIKSDICAFRIIPDHSVCSSADIRAFNYLSSWNCSVFKIFARPSLPFSISMTDTEFLSGEPVASYVGFAGSFMGVAEQQSLRFDRDDDEDAATIGSSQEFMQHAGAIFSLDYNDRQHILVTGSADHTVKVWNAFTTALVQTISVFSDWVVGVDLIEVEGGEDEGHDLQFYLVVQTSRDLSSPLSTVSVWALSGKTSPPMFLLHHHVHFPALHFVCPGICSIKTSDEVYYLSYTSTLGCHRSNWFLKAFDLSNMETTMSLGFNVSVNAYGCNQFLTPLRLLGVGKKMAVVFCEHPSFGTALAILQLAPPKLVGFNPMTSRKGHMIKLGSTDWLDGFDTRNDGGFAFICKLHDREVALCRWT